VHITYIVAQFISNREKSTWDDYVTALNPDDKYYIVKNMRFVESDLASLSQTDNGILLGGTFEEARKQIY
jgi:hypothetical protein